MIGKRRILVIPRNHLVMNKLYYKTFQNTINENVAFWLVSLRGKKLDRPVLAVHFDSNAVKMTTVERDLKKFSEHAFSFSLIRTQL